MNAAGSIPLYPFMKVGFITGLAPGTYRCALSSSPTETVTAFLHSPADLPPYLFPVGNSPVTPLDRKSVV